MNYYDEKNTTSIVAIEVTPDHKRIFSSADGEHGIELTLTDKDSLSEAIDKAVDQVLAKSGVVNYVIACMPSHVQHLSEPKREMVAYDPDTIAKAINSNRSLLSGQRTTVSKELIEKLQLKFKTYHPDNLPAKTKKDDIKLVVDCNHDNQTAAFSLIYAKNGNTEPFFHAVRHVGMGDDTKNNILERVNYLVSVCRQRYPNTSMTLLTTPDVHQVIGNSYVGCNKESPNMAHLPYLLVNNQKAGSHYPQYSKSQYASKVASKRISRCIVTTLEGKSAPEIDLMDGAVSFDLNVAELELKGANKKYSFSLSGFQNGKYFDIPGTLNMFKSRRKIIEKAFEMIGDQAANGMIQEINIPKCAAFENYIKMSGFPVQWQKSDGHMIDAKEVVLSPAKKNTIYVDAVFNPATNNFISASSDIKKGGTEPRPSHKVFCKEPHVRETSVILLAAAEALREFKADNQRTNLVVRDYDAARLMICLNALHNSKKQNLGYGHFYQTFEKMFVSNFFNEAAKAKSHAAKEINEVLMKFANDQYQKSNKHVRCNFKSANKHYQLLNEVFKSIQEFNGSLEVHRYAVKRQTNEINPILNKKAFDLINQVRQGKVETGQVMSFSGSIGLSVKDGKEIERPRDGSEERFRKVQSSKNNSITLE